jgi:outer membrane immunogenic protein
MRLLSLSKIHLISLLVGSVMAFLYPPAALSADQTPYSWTGGYAGVNLGVIWAGSTLTANQVNLLPVSGVYNQNMTSTAVNPGLQLGYLYQIGDNFVIGGEGDFTYPASVSTFTGVSANPSIYPGYDQYKVHYNMQGSLRLRIGYALDRFLPFLTTGVSFGGMSLGYTNDIGDSYSKNTTQTGWVIGGGLEYGFMDNFSARLEYLYTSYGHALNMDTPWIDGIYDSMGSAHATMNTNVLRAAANYRF